MSLEAHFAEQLARDIMGRVHHFVSSVGNALERIDIMIDEDELEEAKREIAELREQLSGVDDPHTYVVIYDVTDDEGEEVEMYYGYFDNSKQAEEVHGDFASGFDTPPRNVRICQIVKDIPDV